MSSDGARTAERRVGRRYVRAATVAALGPAPGDDDGGGGGASPGRPAGAADRWTKIRDGPTDVVADGDYATQLEGVYDRFTSLERRKKKDER